MRPEKLSTQQSLMQLPVCRVSSRQPGQWPQTPSDKSKWCRVILLFSFFACKSYDILIWVMSKFRTRSLPSWILDNSNNWVQVCDGHAFHDSWLLPRVPESTYADSEATKNTWITGLAESHIAIALGGVILLNMSCWSSMVLLLVMSIFFISMWLGPVCRNGLMGIVASAHNPQQLKTQVEPLALHRRLRPRDTHPHNMYIYICIHKLCRLY